MLAAGPDYFHLTVQRAILLGPLVLQPVHFGHENAVAQHLPFLLLPQKFFMMLVNNLKE